jgi:hypothetical protein
VTIACILILVNNGRRVHLYGTAAMEVAHSSAIDSDRDMVHNNVISKTERSLEVTTDAFLVEECRSPEESYPTSVSSDSIMVHHIEGSEAPIMIVDNFLRLESLQTFYEEVVSRDNWSPYISTHVREYRKKGLGDDGVRHIVIL